MAESSNPFSVYDFLGYLIPGLYLVISILWIIGGSQNSVVGLIPSKVEDNVGLIILAYLVGHLSSYLSSITVERFSVWTLGYPSCFLFHKTNQKFFIRSDGNTSAWEAFIRNLMKILVAAALLPIFVLDTLFRKLPRLTKLFAKPFDAIILKAFESAVKEAQDESRDRKGKERRNLSSDALFTGENFRILYHLSIERAGSHRPRMQNYHALYGFLRNTCFTVVFVFWTYLVHNGFETVAAQWTKHLSYLGALVLLMWMLYLSFNKFLRKFCVEVYMASLTIRSFRDIIKRCDLHQQQPKGTPKTGSQGAK